MTNPCPNHINKEISYLVKTVKKGVCDVCVQEHLRQHHEVVWVEDAVNECRAVLLNIEANSLAMLSEKTSGASEYRRKLEMIESDKSAFIAEQ